MSTSGLCRVWAKDGQYYQEAVWDSLKELKTYLNDNFSHNFYSYDFGRSSISASYYSGNDAGEEAFVKDVMQELKEDDRLFSDDNVVISHSSFGFGYGGGAYTIDLDGGGTATGHAVYAGIYARRWEVRGFTWHELVHTMGPWHAAADVDTTSGLMHSITPLGMGYVHDKNNEPDTHYSATGGDQTEHPLNSVSEKTTSTTMGTNTTTRRKITI